ncbi:hypothetical protein SASPL_135953 [Salvia splendens]|uniref:Kinesin motor domain-containing protein n=1 Tax=Salvia splendens TaxID=180675 RepID=A0A8X8WXD1_SALSN|nr:hypothetical protein SASPL_135953 [Salvia splendens]
MRRTLWSSNESPTKDFRSNDDLKGVNVQVVARCRPLSEGEIRAKTSSIISCDETKHQVIATQNTGSKQNDKVFAFDKNGEFHENAGVIPRAVQQIFDVLERDSADYSMKVTFLELYNEEITDLLAPDNAKKSLLLMEDGKGAVFVRGLEEEINSELRVSKQMNGGYGDHGYRHSADALRKQLMELQELYIYQQQLRVDLEDKLLSTERELTTARQSLLNIEDQCQQAKDMCRDKETVIFNLISSEHKNNLEETNRQRVEDFYSQLVQQLQELDEGVSASAKSQEQNWKEFQDDTQLFLTSKAKAIDDLFKKIENLKELHAFGVNNLDGSAEELYQKSQLALSRLSSELSAHSSCIMDLVTKKSSDAHAINNGLKSNMSNLGLRLDAFMKQQEETHARTYHTSKSISSSLVHFFKTMKIYISKLTLIEEDSQNMAKHKLHAFTTKFEEISATEEKLLLEEMAKLLANSSSRKKKMIQEAVDDMLESAFNRGEKLNLEISDMQSLTVDAEGKWNGFIETTKSNYVEDSVAFEAGKCALEDDLQCCMRDLAEVSQQQRLSEESLLDTMKTNFDSEDSVIKNETAAIEKIHARFSSTAASFLEETQDATKKLMLSAENPLRLDQEASEKAGLLSARCLVSTKQTSSIHSEQVADVSRRARKSLVDDYLVDSWSCQSPRKRNVVVASREEIESLMTAIVDNRRGRSACSSSWVGPSLLDVASGPAACGAGAVATANPVSPVVAIAAIAKHRVDQVRVATEGVLLLPCAHAQPIETRVGRT